MNYYELIESLKEKGRPLYEDIATQAPSEIAGLIEAFKQANVRSYLEVGSRYGGSLWRVATSLPKGSRIVSVDSDDGMGGKKPKAFDSLKACVKRLSNLGYDAHLIFGDSQDQRTVDRVRHLGPFDACLLDADHTFVGLSKDWENYGPMSNIVAFHDTHFVEPPNYRENNSPWVEVPAFWQMIKKNYRHQEWHDPTHNFGIGLIYKER